MLAEVCGRRGVRLNFRRGQLAKRSLHMVVAAAVFGSLISSGGFSLRAVAEPAAAPLGLTAAERLYSAGRFAEAHRAYRVLSGGRRRGSVGTWIDFRLADTHWRAEVAKKVPRETVLDSARVSLETMLRALPSLPHDPALVAEINESLADLWLGRPQKGPSWDYPQRARPYLAQARKWWLQNRGAPQRNVRFLRLFWLSQKQWEPYVPVEEKREALLLARSDEERAHLHLLVAAALPRGGPPAIRDVIREYEAGLAIQEKTWRQRLLFAFGQFLRYCGRAEARAGGGFECKPDNDRALVVLTELKRDVAIRKLSGSTVSWYDVDQEIAKIAGPVATAWIQGAFLPGEPIEVTLVKKNLTHLELALYPVHLPQGFDPEFRWQAKTSLEGRTPIRQWTPDASGPANEEIHEKFPIEPLPAGLYLLHLKSDAGESQSPLLVSGLTLLLTRIGSRSALFVARATDGAAVGDAEVAMFNKTDSSGWVPTQLRSDPRGLVALPDGGPDRLFLATKGDEVAWLNVHAPQPALPPRVEAHAFTSKSSYRPGESVTVSFLARSDTGFVTTSPGASLQYVVLLGQAPVSSGTVPLDEPGRGQVSFPLGEDAAPGVYRIRFPALVDLYSRPEERPLFRVVRKPAGDLLVQVLPSRALASSPYGYAQLGAIVRVEKDGKPVAGSFLELTVLKRIFEPGAVERRLDRVTLAHWRPLTGTTDESGEAVFSFPPQAVPSCNFEYEIEAVACGPGEERGFGRGRVRASVTPTFSRLTLEKSIARPGEAVTLGIATFDSEGNPARAQGFVTGRRRTWTEAWTSPDGKVVRGEELRRMRARAARFPPDEPGGARWKLATQPWSEEKVLSIPVDTGAGGSAAVKVLPTTTGRIELRFESPADARSVSPSPGFGRTGGASSADEATLWVVDDSTTASGYQPESLEIQLSRETARPGEDVSALLATPLVNRDVILTISDRAGSEHLVVHVDGNTKVVPLRFPDNGSENLSIAAAMVSEGIVFQCQKDLVLDPDWRRLRIAISSEAGANGARTAALRVTDHAGRPVSAEVTVVLLEGPEEPVRDPFVDLLRQRPILLGRETSLSRFPLVGSGSGRATGIQPPCGRSREWGFDEFGESCEPRFSDSTRDGIEARWSLEPAVPNVLFHSEGLLIGEEGKLTLSLPRCPASSPCRLRVWASGPDHAFAFLETGL